MFTYAEEIILAIIHSFRSEFILSSSFKFLPSAPMTWTTSWVILMPQLLSTPVFIHLVFKIFEFLYDIVSLMDKSKNYQMIAKL